MKLQKLKNKVHRFKRDLSTSKPTPEFLEKVKGMMEEIESGINSFKEHQKEIYEGLIRDERIGLQEMDALEKRIETWSQVPALQLPSGATGVASSRPSSRISTQRDVTKDLPPQVAEFERFSQQNGGPAGGWEHYDHGTFMKFRNRAKGKLSFLQDLIPALPTKTPAEIRTHEQWYREYMRLYELKKEAIQLWKERKEVEKDTVISSARKQDLKSEEDVKLKKQQEIYEQERQQRKAGLNAWKIEKELQKAEEEERRLRQEMEKNREEERQRLKQLELREQVVQYKHQQQMMKQVENEEQRMQEEMVNHIKQRQAAEKISLFQQRDEAKLQEKKLKQKNEEEMKKQKELRLAQIKQHVAVNVESDPNRLYKMTEGWKERKKDRSTSGGQIYHMPHRAVPSWRKT